MMTKKLLIAILGFIMPLAVLFGQPYQVRIAFIGNSITIGSGLANPERDRYPSQLIAMLQEKYGDTIAFDNFAVSGRTMLKHGDFPIWNEARFKDFVAYRPNICFILMGTNDSKPQNWDKYGDEFIPDYLDLMDTVLSRNPHCKFIVCYPPPAYQVVWGIRDSVIYNHVIPAIDSICSETGATLVDFYHPLIDSVHLFPDYIHPNATGAKVMAQIAYNKFIETDIIHQVETGFTYITSFKSDKEEIAQKDNALLSWTTYNADSVLLEGKRVDNSGNKMVSPATTHTYELKAYGKKNDDVAYFEQPVYIPVITYLKINPAKASIANGEDLLLLATYYNQKAVMFEDTVFATQWAISEGEGELINVSGATATFHPVSIGKAKVTATAAEITGKTTISVEGLGISSNQELNELQVYPNPFNNKISIAVNPKSGKTIRLDVYDSKGSIAINKLIYNINPDQKTIDVSLSELKAGLYCIVVEYDGEKYSAKVRKE